MEVDLTQSKQLHWTCVNMSVELSVMIFFYMDTEAVSEDTLDLYTKLVLT